MDIRNDLRFSTTPITLLTRDEYREKMRDCKGLDRDLAKQFLKGAAQKILNKDSVTDIQEEFAVPVYKTTITKNTNMSEFVETEGSCIGYYYDIKTSHSDNNNRSYLVAAPVFEYEVNGQYFYSCLGEATTNTEVYLNSKAHILYNTYHPEQAVYASKHCIKSGFPKAYIVGFVLLLLCIIGAITSKFWGTMLPTSEKYKETVITKVELDDLEENNEGKLILTDDYLEDLSNNYSYDYYEENMPQCLYKYNQENSSVGALFISAFAITFAVTAITVVNRNRKASEAFTDTFDNSGVDKAMISDIKKKNNKSTAKTSFFMLFISAIFTVAGIVIFFFAEPARNPYVMDDYENKWYISHYFNVTVEEDDDMIVVGRSDCYTHFNKHEILYFDTSVSGECYILDNREGIVNIFPVDKYVYEQS